MPSKTFLNLDIKKQKKLLSAAMHEFKTVSYIDVSINKIISQAGISRGSFYMYFTDKDDLFEYLLNLNKKALYKMVQETFVSCKGNIKNAFLKLYDIIVQYIIEYDFSRFIKNMFLYFSIYKEKFERLGHDLFLLVKDFIDTKDINEDDLEFIFHLFMHNLLIDITETVRHHNISLVRKMYRRKVNILCYGIIRRN